MHRSPKCCAHLTWSAKVTGLPLAFPALLPRLGEPYRDPLDASYRREFLILRLRDESGRKRGREEGMQTSDCGWKAGALGFSARWQAKISAKQMAPSQKCSLQAQFVALRGGTKPLLSIWRLLCHPEAPRQSL